MEEIIEKACKHLPEGWQINICMENGAAWINVFRQPDGEFDHLVEGVDQSLKEQLNEALNIANGFKG